MFGEYLYYFVYSWIFWRIFSFYLMSHSWLLSPWNQSSTKSSRRENVQCWRKTVRQHPDNHSPSAKDSLPCLSFLLQNVLSFHTFWCTYHIFQTLDMSPSIPMSFLLCPYSTSSRINYKKKKKSYKKVPRNLIQPRFWTKTLLTWFKVNNHSYRDPVKDLQ